MGEFHAAHAVGSDWRILVAEIVENLDRSSAGGNIGLLYATDYLTRHLGEILAELRRKTGVADWVGTIGFGVGAKPDRGPASASYDKPALAAMVGRLPPGSFRVLEPVPGGFGAFRREYGEWLAQAKPLFAIAHGDPRNPLTPSIIADLAGRTGLFLVGGMTASRTGSFPQIANEVVEGGLSGAFFGAGVGAATGIAQSSEPIGPPHRITGAEHNVVKSLDGRPALAVLEEELTHLPDASPDRIGSDYFVGFPAAGSAGSLPPVHGIIGIDADRGWLATDRPIEPGGPLVFTRLSRAAAENDLKRMLAEVKAHANGKAKGAVYISCSRRGSHLFASAEEEFALVSAALDEVPMVGFYASGEICFNRIYNFTAVLAVFT
ncbi:MAG: FIST signal transduction protein [Pseudomonadota bacterium]